jgi:hypothetical protein
LSPLLVGDDQRCGQLELHTDIDQQLFDHLKRLLLWKTVEEPNKADLISKPQPVMIASAQLDLMYILSRQCRLLGELFSGVAQVHADVYQRIPKRLTVPIRVMFIEYENQ